jgi:hypothetical protein
MSTTSNKKPKKSAFDVYKDEYFYWPPDQENLDIKKKVKGVSHPPSLENANNTLRYKEILESVRNIEDNIALLISATTEMVKVLTEVQKNTMPKFPSIQVTDASCSRGCCAKQTAKEGKIDLDKEEDLWTEYWSDDFSPKFPAKPRKLKPKKKDKK